MALGRDPVAVMQFATQLFDAGSATLGNLKVAPSQDLLQADFGAMLQKAGTSPERLGGGLDALLALCAIRRTSSGRVPGREIPIRWWPR